jgi:hypothetical protein
MILDGAKTVTEADAEVSRRRLRALLRPLAA